MDEKEVMELLKEFEQLVKDYGEKVKELIEDLGNDEIDMGSFVWFDSDDFKSIDNSCGFDLWSSS